MESPGARLKKIRQEKGLSLEEAQKKTKIHLNILKSLEGDSLTDLNPVYLKGFLKIYCKFLGVDPKDCIPDYKQVESRGTTATGTKDTPDKPKKISCLFETTTEKLGSFRPPKKFKTALIFIIVIVLFSIGLFNLGKIISSKHRAALAQEKKTATTQKSKPAQGETLAKAAVSGIKLAIFARENCLVQLKVDGKLVFYKTLERGRSKSWQAKQKMELSLGNAGGVEMEVNAQHIKNLGKRGQPIRNIVITEKEGLKIPR